MFSFKWLGQGGFDIALGGKRVIIDPYLSDSVSRTDGFKRMVPLPCSPADVRADLIITTHDHQDHLDPDTLCAMPADCNMFAGPESCVRHMRTLGIPEGRIRRFGAGDVIHLGDTRLMGVPAVHTSSEAIGVVIEYHGTRLYFSGDTLYDKRLEDVGALGIDVMFVCINGHLGNMDYREAAKIAKALPCRVVVPDHYGMFAENTVDPDLFVNEMSGSGIYVHTPEFNTECEILELLRRAENG